MIQEDKELLLKDISARLLYGVIVYDYDREETREIGLGTLHDIMFNDLEYKLYLRPMSSMTDGERNEYFNIIKNTIDFYNCPKSEGICFLIIPIDWLNAHHFDYRGLIEKGLALEAPEGMYNIN